MITPVDMLHDADALKALLASVNLPVSDVRMSAPQKFFGIHQESMLVAAIGLECYEPVALLRSLAVRPSHRKQGLARMLVRYAENQAADQGIHSLYLLTTTAEAFFTRLGYANSSRTSAPPSLAASAQFSGLCPASSAFLSKSIMHPASR